MSHDSVPPLSRRPWAPPPLWAPTSGRRRRATPAPRPRTPACSRTSPPPRTSRSGSGSPAPWSKAPTTRCTPGGGTFGVGVRLPPLRAIHLTREHPARRDPGAGDVLVVLRFRSAHHQLRHGGLALRRRGQAGRVLRPRPRRAPEDLHQRGDHLAHRVRPAQLRGAVLPDDRAEGRPDQPPLAGQLPDLRAVQLRRGAGGALDLGGEPGERRPIRTSPSPRPATRCWDGSIGSW